MNRVAGAMAAAWLTAAMPASAQSVTKQKKYVVPTIPSVTQGVQLIYGQILDQDPARFRINFDFNTNASVDEKAPAFAVYFDEQIPQRCADYRGYSLSYTKQGRQGVFDVRDFMPHIFHALNQYRCITISNQNQLTAR